MLKVKPPFKLSIAAVLFEHESLGHNRLFELIREQYAGEKIGTEANIEHALQSLKAVGIVKIECDGEEPQYSLSAHGRKKVQKAL